ncbi:hypothetical protein NBRC110019_05440 [Neptunitalea chrysea]|uniref:Thioredoxin domain-containing protein n=1 Tax=Neptunitalea chrysea TaxID=1647581 RepID=A0A9W6B3A7_9FLAO|nr:TlpA disulfide reductase family protein [Neptunitalea chrysea]GLB51505.1 hypothetical protein NBRC110019_05440 [Neptunitalea chrysea]
MKIKHPSIKVLFICVACCFVLAASSFNNKNVNQRRHFSQIIENYEGKVIYLDFWASWCKPCRKEIRNTKKLKSLNQNKDIKFVYISVDLDKEQCERAIKKDGVIDTKNNYYLLDIIKDSTYQNIKFNKMLPYYAIIGKDGTICTNAPRPSEKEELQKKLDEFLKR